MLREVTIDRVGGWLPSNHEVMQGWLAQQIEKSECRCEGGEMPPLQPSIQKLRDLIYGDATLFMLATQMIDQVPNVGKFEHDPTGGQQIRCIDQMLCLMNGIIQTAPEYNDTDLIGFPLNAVLDWSMGTQAGSMFFLDPQVNACLKEILTDWCVFLSSPESRYVLNDSPTGWFSPEALKRLHLEQYKQYDPSKPYRGFTSWNDFFTRQLKAGLRPVAGADDSKVIVNACESTPYRIATDVQRRTRFWLKSQPYALEFMLEGSGHVDDFIGGTVYQAFLSATHYHRWHSPVSGRIKKAYVQNGSYYAEALSEHFDPAGPNNSQGYITQVATRAIIIIECDDPDIGLVCVMPVGMSEVSSNVITVEEGQKVIKGEELGYFQFGGSTHCVMFQKDVIEEFALGAIPPLDFNANSQVNLVNSLLATARGRRG